ncbi:MAG: hypothetical protein ACFFFG_07570 [Candidatus Thorarchaeota archaeon]
MIHSNSQQSPAVQQVELSFISDFTKYWDKIRDFCSVERSTVRSVCAKLFEDWTKPFFERWSTTELIKPYLVWRSNYASRFSSFGLLYNGKMLLIPHKLVSNILDSQVREHVYFREFTDIKTFFYYLWQVTQVQQNFPLNASDLKLISFYTSSGFMRTSARFPSQELLADVLSCNPRTISTRSTRLYNHYILTHTYLIDVAKLGYQTMAFLSQDPSDIHGSLTKYCLGTLPIDLGLTRGNLKIFQIPYWKHDVFNAVTDSLGPVAGYNLTQLSISWNLSQLSTNPDSRWLNEPPVLVGIAWDDTDIILEDIGVDLNLVPDIQQSPGISKSQAKLLSFYYSHGTVQDKQLSEFLELDPHSVFRLWQDILDRNVAYPYTHVSNIGLDLSLWVMLLGKTKQDNSDLVSKVVAHLRYFPYARTFYSSGNSNEGTFLVAEIRIPSLWYKDFATHWDNLTNYELIPKVGVLTPEFHLKRNINVLDTLF